MGCDGGVSGVSLSVVSSADDKNGKIAGNGGIWSDDGSSDGSDSESDAVMPKYHNEDGNPARANIKQTLGSYGPSSLVGPSEPDEPRRKRRLRKKASKARSSAPAAEEAKDVDGADRLGPPPPLCLSHADSSDPSHVGTSNAAHASSTGHGVVREGLVSIGSSRKAGAHVIR
ncbi:hypothetical protein Tco_0299309 [Tanacetum coccineum]